MSRMLILVLLLGLTGCRTMTGADWEGGTTDPTRLLFVAGYAQSVHVEPIVLDIPAGRTSEDVAAQQEAAWNGGRLGQAFRCPNDPSIIKFPGNVGEMVVIDEHLNVHRITDAATVLPNGLTIRRHTGRCP